MAAVQKLASGTWRCQVRKKGYPAQGRTFPTRARAVAWGTEVEAQMGRQVYVVPDKATADMTVAQMLDRYTRDESPQKASASDDKQRAGPLKSELGEFRAMDVTNSMLTTYKRNRLLVLAPQTVTHELNLLHRAYVVATQDWGLVLPRGVPRTTRPTLPEGRERRVPKAELEALLACTGSPELHDIVTLAVETGMRRGEIIALDWSRIDLCTRTVFLAHTKTRTPRTIPLSTRAVAVLHKVPAKGRRGRVFSITGRCASQAFKRAVDRAGLKNLHFHDLRHEATSRLFERGLNVLEVSSVTGHKNLKMLKRYTHLEASRLVSKLG